LYIRMKNTGDRRRETGDLRSDDRAFYQALGHAATAATAVSGPGLGEGGSAAFIRAR
jgi:hypothetical protein